MHEDELHLIQEKLRACQKQLEQHQTASLKESLGSDRASESDGTSNHEGEDSKQRLV